MSAKIEVRNINAPNHITNVDKAKYDAMYAAMMQVLPDDPPGMSVSDVIAAVKPMLPEDLYPGGKTSGWWVKCVQLDLEFKKVIARAPKPPVRLHKL